MWPRDLNKKKKGYICLSIATLLFLGDSALVCYISQSIISKVNNNVTVLSNDDLGNFLKNQDFVFHFTTNDILNMPVKKTQNTQRKKPPKGTTHGPPKGQPISEPSVSTLVPVATSDPEIFPPVTKHPFGWRNVFKDLLIHSTDFTFYQVLQEERETEYCPCFRHLSAFLSRPLPPFPPPDQEFLL